MYALSQASASLDVVTPANNTTIHVFVTSSNRQPQPEVLEEGSAGSTAQACFLPHGFLLARVLADPSQVAVQWLSMGTANEAHAPNSNSRYASVSPLTKSPALPAVVCQFPAAVSPKCLLLKQDAAAEVVYLVALTAAGFLYRVVFPAPLYCYASPADLEASATQFQLPQLANKSKKAIRIESLDEDSLLLALDDGSLFKLDQNRLDDHTRGNQLRRHEDAWQETALAAHSSWSLFQHNQSPQDTVVSTASLQSQRDVLDVAFTLSRDKKLKIWSLSRHRLIKTFDLAQLTACFTASDAVVRRQDDGYKHTSLLPSMALPYLHVFHTDSIDSDYGAYLALYAPQAHSFLFFGIDVDDAGQVSQLVPILQKPMDAGFAAELVDFKAARVDRKVLSAAEQETSRASSWTLWTLWAVGKQTQMVFIELPELEVMSSGSVLEACQTGWVPVVRPNLPDIFLPVNNVSLAELPEESRQDTTSVATLVNERYLDHLFLPGRYSIPVLESALLTYLDTSDVEEPARDNNNTPFRDIVASVISSTVSLKTSAKTGQVLITDFMQDLEYEWARYTAIANELKLEAGFPLALCIDEATGTVLSLERDSISVPVLQNEATLLQSQIASGSNDPFLAIPEEQLVDAYPHLAPVGVRETVVAVCRLARTLVNAANQAQGRALLEEELLNLACSAPTCTLSEAAANVYDTAIGPSALAEDSDREALLGQLTELPLLLEAFRALLNILSQPELCGQSSVLDGDLCDLQDPSYLSLALVTSITMEALEARYTLALDVVALLCVVQAEQEDLIPGMDALLNGFFASFQRLFNLRSLSQSPTVPITDQDDQEASNNDSLTAHLEALSMGQTTAVDLPALPLDPFSLLNALLRQAPLTPLLLSSLSNSLVQCVSAFLHSIGIVAPTRSIEATTQDAAFAFRLFSLGCSFEALSFADTYPKSSLMDYVRGRALLDMGDVENAQSAFELAAADTATISTILIGYTDLEHELSPALYYRHVADLFFQQDTRDPVFAFCSLAVQSGLEVLEENVQREVWLRLFQSANETSRFLDAYTTMTRIPFVDLRKECLRQLVSAMCESGETSTLLSMPFFGMKEELEQQVEFRAWNSDPRAVPSYPCLLYSLLISRGDYRKAAETMYTHARRLGHVDLRRYDFDVVATARCQSYLAAISALMLVDAAHRWISCDLSRAQSLPDRKQSLTQLSNEALSNSSEAHKPLLLTVDDIRKEYTQVLARLELVAFLPDLSTSVRDLSPDTVVALYAQRGLYEKALSAAKTLNVDMAPLFEALARKCVKLDSVEGSQTYTDSDASWVFEDQVTRTWGGTLASKAWHLLGHYLEEYDDGSNRLHEAAADKVLDLDGDLPAPIVQLFAKRNPSILARLLVKHGALNPALRFSIGLLKSTSQLKKGQAKPSLPWSVFDTLLASRDEIIDKTLQEALQAEVRTCVSRSGASTAFAGRFVR